MGIYRKRPVEVKAWKIDTETLIDDLPEWVINALSNYYIKFNHDGTNTILVSTLEGVMRSKPNSYLIQGVNGEYYPCEASIFEKTYEFVRREE